MADIAERRAEADHREVHREKGGRRKDGKRTKSENGTKEERSNRDEKTGNAAEDHTAEELENG